MESLDNILSGDGTAPEPEKQEVVEGVTQEQPAKATEPQDEVSESPDGRKMVPLEALTEARGKAKRYTEQVAEFDKTVKGLQEQNGTLQRQVAELLQRLPVQQQPQQQPPDWFENPEARTDHQIGQRVTPQIDHINQQLLSIAKDNAIVRFTEEKVDAAEAAFISALQTQKLDPADYHKVVGSPNRYAAAVQWHQRQLAQAEIGDDPAAFKARLEAEILEKHGLKAAGGTAPPAVMPSNLAGARNVGTRSGPAWAGPTTLTDIFKR